MRLQSIIEFNIEELYDDDLSHYIVTILSVVSPHYFCKINEDYELELYSVSDANNIFELLKHHIQYTEDDWQVRVKYHHLEDKLFGIQKITEPEGTIFKLK